MEVVGEGMRGWVGGIRPCQGKAQLGSSSMAKNEHLLMGGRLVNQGALCKSFCFNPQSTDRCYYNT